MRHLQFRWFEVGLRPFTARFGQGPGPVMSGRICTGNGIGHILTAPYSPTRTGKIERLHKTMRAEFFTPKDRLFTSMEDLQEALDSWVTEYNTTRPHQSCGGRPPLSGSLWRTGPWPLTRPPRRSRRRRPGRPARAQRGCRGG